jgi:hypothetical protein
VVTEKIRAGIIEANVRYGWGRDTHIPALSALPELATRTPEASDVVFRFEGSDEV